MVGVLLDQRRDAQAVRRVMAGFHQHAAIFADGGINDFGSHSELPTTFVIDRKGRVVARLAGGKPPIADQTLENLLADRGR
jgi:hypothetical protein